MCVNFDGKSVNVDSFPVMLLWCPYYIACYADRLEDLTTTKNRHPQKKKKKKKKKKKIKVCTVIPITRGSLLDGVR